MKTLKMITTASLLDLLNEYKGWTDYRIAKELGTKSGLVAKWRNHGTVMSDKYVAQVAEILGFKEDWLLLHIHAERHFKQPFFGKLKELAENETPPEAVKLLDRLKTLDSVEIADKFTIK